MKYENKDELDSAARGCTYMAGGISLLILIVGGIIYMVNQYG